MADVIYTNTFLAVFSELSAREQAMIVDSAEYLKTFPEMFKRVETGRFRGSRVFAAGNWLVYYQYRSGAVYLRNIWPARIPYR